MFAMGKMGNREIMLEAAIELLEGGGEAAVRVDPVVDAASVTKPSLYHYFGDRDGLIVAAQAERYRRSLLYGMEGQREATERCQSREEFMNLVRSWMEAITGPDGEERRRVRVEVLGSAASRPQLRSQTSEMDTIAASELGELLRVAHGRGWVKTEFDLDVAAIWWYGMMNGRYLVEKTQTPLVRREWDAIAVEATLSLLFGPDRP
jgi:AcrR family transcriptional regulator